MDFYQKTSNNSREIPVMVSGLHPLKYSLAFLMQAMKSKTNTKSV